MWVNYFKTYAGRSWVTELSFYNFSCVSTWEDGHIPTNECSMMIPGTYREMHNDYD